MATPIYTPPSTGYTAAFGGVPQVPDPTSTARDATSGAIGNYGGLMALLNMINPSYSQQNRVIGSELRGELPADVVGQINQFGAERGVNRGVTGSPNSMAAIMRALGLASLGQTAKGMSDAGNVAGQTGQILSPFMATARDQQQSAADAFMLKSAPNPAAANAASMDAVRAGMNSAWAAKHPTPQGAKADPNASVAKGDFIDSNGMWGNFDASGLINGYQGRTGGTMQDGLYMGKGANIPVPDSMYRNSPPPFMTTPNNGIYMGNKFNKPDPLADFWDMWDDSAEPGLLNDGSVDPNQSTGNTDTGVDDFSSWWEDL